MTGQPTDPAVARLVDELAQLGVRLHLTDGRLAYRAPVGALTDELRQRLRAHREALVAYLAGAGGQRPLTHRQLRIWLLHQRFGGSTGYHVSGAFQLHGPVEPELFAAAVQQVVADQPALRSVVELVDGLPVLSVRPLSPVQVPVVTVAGGTAALAHQMVAEVVDAPFDLSTGPLLRVALLRVAPDEHVAVLAVHHLVADDHSVRLLGEQTLTAYGRLAAGEPVGALPAVADEPADPDWQRDPQLAEQVRRRRERLTDAAPMRLPAPTGVAGVDRSPWSAHSATVRLSAAQRQQWQAARRGLGATSLVVHLATVGLAVAAAGGPTDLLVGTPGFGREDAAQWRSIGYFATTAVVRVRVDAAPTFGALLKAVAADLADAWAVQRVPYEEIVADRSQAVDGGHVMWLVVYPDDELPQPAGLRVTPFSVQSQQARHDLRLGVRPWAQGTEWALTYRPGAVDGEFMARFTDALRDLSVDVPAESAVMEQIVAHIVARSNSKPLNRRDNAGDSTASRLLSVAAQRRREVVVD